MATSPIDWFNQDSVYRTTAGNSLADLTSTLAQLMNTRNNDYTALDNQQNALTQNRTTDLTALGNDVAARGLQGSGLYAQSADKTGQAYALKQNDLNQSRNTIQQQYGQAGTKVPLDTINGANGQANLSSTYGLLGQLGVNAGNAYNQAISAAKAASAARSAQPLVGNF